MATLNESLLAADSDAVIPRIKLGESGWSGLAVTNKQIQQEANRQFRYPQFIKVVDEMRNDQTVAACLTAYRTLVGRVKWDIEPPVGATEQQKERAAFIRSCMVDMEHSWQAFITEVMSYMEYGFSVHEKVFRRRMRSNGSKYNDGLVGWKKLAPRSQTTISGWKFKNYGRELDYLEQDISNLDDLDRYNLAAPNSTKIHLPRDKVLLFTCDATLENPEGRSLLKGAYTAYRRLQLLQDQMMIGVARDLGGIPIIWLHPKYLSASATAEEAATAQSFYDLAEGLTTGSRGSAVMPLMYDDAAKQKIFDIELLESKGGKNFDIPKIVDYLQKDIVAALSCQNLKAVGNTADRYSVGEGATNLMALHLDYRLREIAAVINQDLIPATFRANGWTDTDLPQLVFGDLDDISLDEIGKYLQRTAAVGLVELDRATVNLVRERMGLPKKADDEPVDREQMTNFSSSSGESFSTATGGLNGTSDKPPKDDRSTANKENAG